MRIQTLAEKTGISKRNIHFYIKENLIEPKTEEKNGYFDFTEEDVEKLIFIKKLREAGLSVSAIKTILHRPKSAEYYLRMRLGKIEEEKAMLENTREQISDILENVAVNMDLTVLYKLVNKRNFNVKNNDSSNYDGKLVNHFLWRIYWEEENYTEYQQFLWEKIIKLTDKKDKNIYYAQLYDYLHSQGHEKIYSLYEEKNHHFNRVAAFNDKEIIDYANELKVIIREFVNSPKSIKQWKETYHSYTYPLFKIYTGDLGRIAAQMSPFFNIYREKSLKACNMVYEWLNTEEGSKLKNDILNTLEGYVDIEHCGHAELEAMNTLFDC